MRDSVITVRKYNDILITVARTAPLENTIIVRANNGTIEALAPLKQKASDILGTTPTVPRKNTTVVDFF